MATADEREARLKAGKLTEVQTWRFHVLVEADYPLPLAEKLAASDADLHRAVKLVEQGCKPETAARILV